MKVSDLALAPAADLKRLERYEKALKEIARHDGFWQGAQDAYEHIKTAKAALKE